MASGGKNLGWGFRARLERSFSFDLVLGSAVFGFRAAGWGRRVRVRIVSDNILRYIYV